MFKISEKIILLTVLMSLVTTAGFFLFINPYYFVIGNIVEHVLASIFFVGVLIAIYALVVKQEYKTISRSKKSILLAVTVFILVVILSPDYWYTLVTPHPILNKQFGI
jgi:membrane protein CcdC involved in cytochrome C biogenesis